MEKEKLNTLQVCRAIAALLVVFRHFTINSEIFLGHNFAYGLFAFGHAGVNFFFVLSGFIICYVHWNDIHTNFFNLKRYFGKRLTRILPVYWPTLVVVTLLYLYFGNLSYVNHSAITALAFFQNLFFVSFDEWPIVAVSRTLQYEMLFYLMFACFIINKNIGMLIFGAWVVLTLLFTFHVIAFSNAFIGFMLDLYSLQFLLGCVIAYLIKKERFYNISSNIVFTIGLLGFIVCGLHEDFINDFNGDYYSTFSLLNYQTFYSLFSGIIIFGLVRMEQQSYIFLPRFLIYLGSASYAIYLTHNMLLSIFFRVAQHIQLPCLNFTAQVLFILTFSILIGCMVHSYYEKPTIRFLRKPFIFMNRKLKIAEG